LTNAASATAPAMPQFGAFGPPLESGAAVGPVTGAVADAPRAGWAVEHDDVHAPEVRGGAVRIAGNSRAYLVSDHTASARGGWEGLSYARLDLQRHALSFTIDISHVPCGCFACVHARTRPRRQTMPD
jgi:hypothetical protein